MSRNTFWQAQVTHHDEGDRNENIRIHASGLPPDPERVLEFIKTHNYRNRRVTITNVRPLTGDASDLAGHPFIGQENDNLYNAAGKQVTENHEVVQPSPPEAPQTA